MTAEIEEKYYKKKVYYIVWVFDETGKIAGFQKFYNKEDANWFCQVMNLNQKGPV